MRIPSGSLALMLMAACVDARSSHAPSAVAGSGADTGLGQGASPVAGTAALPRAFGHDTSRPATPASRAGTVEAGAGAAGRAMESDADGGSEVEPDRLCDGSPEIRLLYNAAYGGPTENTFPFTNPFGFFFLAVDGMCRYYANSNPDLGIATGVLDAQDEQQLAAALHWRDLAAWSAQMRADGTCPDAGLVMLGRLDAVATCSCGCDPNAPQGLPDAIQSARDWMLQLEARGPTLTGPVSGLAVPMQSLPWNQPPTVDWPLARTMSTIANLIMSQDDPGFAEPPYALFDAATETSELRALRAERARIRMNSGTFLVREDAAIYNVLIRDELPADTVESLNRMQQSWPLP